ncbi:MAG: hypothetical protein CMO55_10350 [Verrucomicrobiales bacterium]|nr:hypothetical protein [Verrucomicrobiales bacterium]
MDWLLGLMPLEWFLEGSFWMLVVAFFAVPLWLVFFPPRLLQKYWWLRPVVATVVFSGFHFAYYYWVLIPVSIAYLAKYDLGIIEPMVARVLPEKTIVPAMGLASALFALWGAGRLASRFVIRRTRLRVVK